MPYFLISINIDILYIVYEKCILIYKSIIRDEYNLCTSLLIDQSLLFIMMDLFFYCKASLHFIFVKLKSLQSNQDKSAILFATPLHRCTKSVLC